jgi:hypothetical protein
VAFGVHPEKEAWSLMGTLKGDFHVPRVKLIQRLGEARYGLESGLVGELNLLARMGLPIAEGIVLTHEFHREFMEMSGLLQALQASENWLEDARRYALEASSRYRSISIEGELNRLICDSLIELGASMVVVLSEGTAESGLKSIPEVRAAVRGAWLSPDGLERQIEAVARGDDPPAWPVLVQRELHRGGDRW